MSTWLWPPVDDDQVERRMVEHLESALGGRLQPYVVTSL